jgi:hypothetical protein
MWSGELRMRTYFTLFNHVVSVTYYTCKKILNYLEYVWSGKLCMGTCLLHSFQQWRSQLLTIIVNLVKILLNMCGQVNCVWVLTSPISTMRSQSLTILVNLLKILLNMCGQVNCVCELTSPISTMWSQLLTILVNLFKTPLNICGQLNCVWAPASFTSFNHVVSVTYYTCKSFKNTFEYMWSGDLCMGTCLLHQFQPCGLSYLLYL